MEAEDFDAISLVSIASLDSDAISPVGDVSLLPVGGARLEEAAASPWGPCKDLCPEVAPSICFQVTERASLFMGKKTRIVKTIHTAAGKIAVSMVPVQTSPSWGGCSFGASRGRGRLEVKCCSDDLAAAGRLVQARVGRSCSQLHHRFAEDGLTCRVADTFDFFGAAEKGVVRVMLKLLMS